MYKKLIALFVLFVFALGITYADDIADQLQVKTHINNMRNSTYESWILGDIFTKVFNDQWKIKDVYLGFINTLTDWYIPFWSGWQLHDSIIYSSWSNVWIWTTILSEKLTLAWGISITKSPDTWDDVWNRNYNDARYLWITDKAAESDLLDGIDSTWFEDVHNLLPVDEWTIWSWSVSIFTNNWTVTENYRIWWENPHWERSIIWEARPDAASDADWWWNAVIPIDHAKSYRSIIWLKKTWSIWWTSYFWAHWTYTNNLDWTPNTNPYYWSWDLPELDKWYLLVWYIHWSSDSDMVNHGWIYDWETWEKVLSIKDFKNKLWATEQRHRAFLYYDLTTTDRQYFWWARFEELNWDEPTIDSLLWLDVSVFQKDIAAFSCGYWIASIWDDGSVVCAAASDTKLTEAEVDAYVSNNWYDTTPDTIADDGIIQETEIAQWTLDDSEIEDDSLTAASLAINSVWNDELIDIPTVTQLNVLPWNDNWIRFRSSESYEISMSNWATHKYWPVTDYSIKTNMSNTVWRWFTWGVVWLAPKAWLEATTWNFQTAGSINAVWWLQENWTVLSSKYLGITEKATDSDKLDTIDSTSFLRSDANDTFTWLLSVWNTLLRQAWIYWIYDSFKIGHIWSMWTAYKIASDGSNFGNLYWLAYKHTNNTTWWTMAWGHQMVWAQNGVGTSAMGTNIWTSWAVIVDAATVIGADGYVEWDRIRDWTIDSTKIQDNTLTASDLAANSVWDSELIDNPTVTQLTVNSAPVNPTDVATKDYVDNNAWWTPAWAVMAFYLSACPTGWIPADWTSWTPDLRWAFIRGMNGDLNSRDVVRVLWDYQADSVMSHLHSVDPPNTAGSAASAWAHTHSYTQTSSSRSATSGTSSMLWNYVGSTWSAWAHTHTVYVNIAAFNSSSYWWTETTPKNIALLYCMKS